MVKRYFTLIVVVLFVAVAFGQKEEREANYQFEKMQNYTVALDMYQKIYDKDTTNETVIYRLGISYLNCNKKPSEALKYLKKVELSRVNDPVFLFDMGKAYMYNYKFKEAKTYFEKCRDMASKSPELKANANVWIQMVDNAARMVKNPLDVSFINMGKYINTPMDELTPYVFPDNEMLFYTSNNKYDRKFFIYTYNVYSSVQSGGVFKKGKSLTVVNTMDDEYIAGISMNSQRIFVQLQGYEMFQDLIYSDRNNKTFKGKIPLGKTINTKLPEFGACETVNGDTLFFSSGREGGLGGMDIYYSLRLPTGEWSEPRNLGGAINSPYDDDLPVLADDGSTLYFTSNRPESMGGYDIFKSKIRKDRTFSQPVNIGYPLNDVLDNKTIAFSHNKRYAYVSAVRPEGYGSMDLYRVVFNSIDPSVKIYILKFKKQAGDTKVDFAETDTTVKITSYTKNKVVFGEYAYKKSSSSATVALPPGLYTVEVKGDNIESISKKITVPDIPSGKKVETVEVVLKAKNN